MPEYSDGTMPHGAPTITIDTVDYIINNVRVTKGSNTIRSNNENGAAARQVVMPGFVDGSATLQLATTTTPLPDVGDTFVEDLLKAGSTQTWIVQDVGIAYEEQGETLVDITFTKKLN